MSSEALNRLRQLCHDENEFSQVTSLCGGNVNTIDFCCELMACGLPADEVEQFTLRARDKGLVADSSLGQLIASFFRNDALMREFNQANRLKDQLLSQVAQLTGLSPDSDELRQMRLIDLREIVRRHRSG